MSRKSSEGTRPILVAIDFSPHSLGALQWAAQAADCLDVPVLLLHVVHDPESAPGYYLNAKKRKKLLRRFEERADEMMEEFVSDALKKYPDLRKIKKLETNLVIGLPVTRILEIAKQRDAQLIVVGSQGRTGLPHLLLGSKALKVAQLSPIPVTIVKDGGPADDNDSSDAPKETKS